MHVDSVWAMAVEVEADVLEKELCRPCGEKE